MASASSLSPPAHLLYQKSGRQRLIELGESRYGAGLTILLSRLDFLARINLADLDLFPRGLEFALWRRRDVCGSHGGVDVLKWMDKQSKR